MWSADYAILAMSIHMALQIFRPGSSVFGHDGLYRFRHTVIGGWLVVPAFDAALAFVSHDMGYMAQGAFCSLPIRPFWYRLALSWIPRYLIFITVLGIAVRIYRHVGKGFKVFAREQDRSSKSNDPAQQRSSQHPAWLKEQQASSDGSIQLQDRPNPNRQPSIVAGELQDLSALAAASRQNSVGDNGSPTPPCMPWPSSFSFSGKGATPGGSQGPSRRASRVSFSHEGEGVGSTDFLTPPEHTNNTGKRGSVATIVTFKSMDGSFNDGMRTPANLTTIDEIHPAASQLSNATPQLMSVDNPIKQRQRMIQRQLRLLFIYPCVYMIFWVIPFVQHCLNYSDYYANHPIYQISAIATFCQTFMGFADCLVFSWRERPWRHIPGSDGTVLGSFCFWRFGKTDVLPRYNNDDEGGSGSESLSTSTPHDSGTGRTPRASISSKQPPPPAAQIPVHKKTFSGGSDRARLEADRAAERLAMERAEYERMRGPSKPSKDWWDREMSTSDEEGGA
ncbi:G protein-coupled receptor gpr1 [Zalaria obscura]|uniref:G protein-coupled receptor gpr1 n=1 Tax=Zalaria obscura TaxID=2024903 RepID=A0ACC3SCP0_9PEZI